MNFIVNLQVCRVCMKMEKGLSLQENVEIRKKFTFTTKLEINPSDNLSPLLCMKCVERLTAAHDFIKAAQKSDKKFQEFLSTISQNFSKISNDFLQSACSDTSDTEESRQVMKTNKTAASARKKSEIGKSVTFKLDPPSGVDEDDDVKPISSSNTESPLSSPKMDNVEEIIVTEENVEEDDQCLNECLADNDVVDEEINVLDQQEAEISLLISQEVQNHNNSQDDNKNFCTSDINDQVIIMETENYDEEVVGESSQSANVPNIANTSHSSFSPKTEILLDNNLCSENYIDSEDNPIIELQLYEEQDGNLIAFQDHNSELNDHATIQLKRGSSSSLGEDYKQEQQQQSAYVTSEISDSSLLSSENSKTKLANKSKSSSKSAGGDQSSFICEICNKDFATKTNLNRHMATHDSNPRPYHCNICGKRFTQNVSLKTHLFTHTGQKPHVCEFCNRGFTQAKSLVFHLRRHTGEKPFCCVACGQNFRQKDGLRMHILKHLQVEGVVHKCVSCEMCLDTKDDFEKHMKLHSNNPPLKQELGEDSKPSANSKSDKDELLKDKAYILSAEGSTGSMPNRAKIFQCRQCFKTFSLKKSLLRHVATHTNNSSQVSSTTPSPKISLSFYPPTNNSAILKTTTTSTKIVFQCSQCDLIFKRNADLTMHYRNHHRNSNTLEEPHNCYMCELDFETDYELRDHLMQHHNIIE